MAIISQRELRLLGITGEFPVPLRRKNAEYLTERLHRAIGRDPEIFPDGDEFKPGRWLDQDGKVKPDMKVSHRLSVAYADSNLTASNILLYPTKSTPSFLLSALEDGIYFSFSLRLGIRTDHILRCECSICPGAEVATR